MATNMALAEWLIARIDNWCAESGGALVVVRSPADLARCVAVGGPVGVLLNVQGGHVLDGSLANVARLRALGVRMFAPAHVMDNALVGSGTGRAAGGLSGFGGEVIAELETQSMLVDLAHMSVAGIEATLPLLHRPFTLSHTGLTDIAGGRSRWRRYSPATRNVTAALAAKVARAGGLVGVVLATQLLGGDDLVDAVVMIKAVLSAAGDDRVAIGSDMDGALREVIDMAGLPALTSALFDGGLAPETVAKVMGGNAVALLTNALPAE